MRLLIITQKININDDVLGFMHGWINEFAKHCDSVVAVCLEKGDFRLPANVKVLSLGKENRRRPLKRIRYLINFYRIIWSERNNYDKVLVHMNDEYVVMGGLLWRILGKRIGLWYAHGHIPFSLRMAEKLADIIFTSTRSGCRLNSKKIKIIGQGIEVEKYELCKKEENKKGASFNVVSIGRISPSKNYETLIGAVELIIKKYQHFHVEIIGGAGTADQEKYLNGLKEAVEEKGLEKIINFSGPLPNRKIAGALSRADLFVNMGLTGSLDKAILEAMAAGLPVLTCNEALLGVLGDYSGLLMYEKNNYQELAEKIYSIYCMPPRARVKLGAELRQIVTKNHGLSEFAKKVIQLL